jgi:hypothetical protein
MGTTGIAHQASLSPPLLLQLVQALLHRGRTNASLMGTTGIARQAYLSQPRLLQQVRLLLQQRRAGA